MNKLEEEVLKRQFVQAKEYWDFYKMVSEDQSRFIAFIRELLTGTEYLKVFDDAMSQFIKRLGEEENNNVI